MRGKKGKHLPEDDYEPVICKKCKEEIYQTVALVVRAPMGWKCLTKEGLRNRRIQILGAQYEDTQWSCGCDPVEAPAKKKALLTDRRLRPAGQRWTKKHVPGEPDPRTVNPAPVAETEDPFDPWKEATGD